MDIFPMTVQFHGQNEYDKRAVRTRDWFLRPRWALRESRKCDHDWEPIEHNLDPGDISAFKEHCQEHGYPLLPGFERAPIPYPIAQAISTQITMSTLENGLGDRVCLKCKVVDRRFSDHVRGTMPQFAVDMATAEARERKAQQILENHDDH